MVAVCCVAIDSYVSNGIELDGRSAARLLLDGNLRLVARMTAAGRSLPSARGSRRSVGGLSGPAPPGGAYTIHHSMAAHTIECNLRGSDREQAEHLFDGRSDGADGVAFRRGTRQYAGKSGWHRRRRFASAYRASPLAADRAFRCGPGSDPHVSAPTRTHASFPSTRRHLPITCVWAVTARSAWARCTSSARINCMASRSG